MWLKTQGNSGGGGKKNSCYCIHHHAYIYGMYISTEQITTVFESYSSLYDELFSITPIYGGFVVTASANIHVKAAIGFGADSRLEQTIDSDFTNGQEIFRSSQGGNFFFAFTEL